MQQIKWNCIEHYIVIQHSSPLPLLFPLSSPLSACLRWCALGISDKWKEKCNAHNKLYKVQKILLFIWFVAAHCQQQRQCCPCCPVKQTLRPAIPPSTTSPISMHAPANARTHARLSRGSQNGWQLNALYCMPRRGQWGERREAKGMGYTTHNAGHWPWAPT